MRIAWYILLFLVFFSISVSSIAQEHYDAWFRITLSVPVISRISADAELQHRRQNGMGNNDLFNKNLTISGRGWLHYRVKENMRLSFSPIAYFSNYRLIQTYDDEKKAPSGEYRISAAAELSRNISEKVHLLARPAIEYRVFEHTNNLLRGRVRLQIRADVHAKVSLDAYEEVLCNIVGADMDHIVDQNRLCADIEYRIFKDVKVNMGYMRLRRQPMDAFVATTENNLIVNVVFQLLTKEK